MTNLDAVRACVATLEHDGTGLPDNLAEAAYAALTDHARSTCPAWCTTDHATDIRGSLPGDGYEHRHEIGEGSPWVAVVARVYPLSGLMEIPVVRVCDLERGLDAPAADRLAGLLTEAAAIVRRAVEDGGNDER